MGADGPASWVKITSSDFPTNARLSADDGAGSWNSENTIRWLSRMSERLSTNVPSKSNMISFKGFLSKMPAVIGMSSIDAGMNTS
jgi:hypothetical protein